MSIRILHRSEIETEKWNEVISSSPGEALYPYSWYLDAAAENWSALVLEDYRFIMPLVWKKKYGIRYLYQPVFCQQLGVLGKEEAVPEVVRTFIDEALKYFRFGTVNLNAGNKLEGDRRFEISGRNNHVLSLQPAYGELSSGYSENARRNLKRSPDSPEIVAKDIPLDELIAFKKKNDLTAKPEAAYQRMRSLFGSVMARNRGQIYGIREKGELAAATFIALSEGRIYYLLSVSSEQGKELRAMFRIVDALIHEHAGSGLILDFEGSNIPSIARFFEGFGATPEIYQSISFNNLPFPLNFGKRYGR